ncbi:MAG: hypothetical protein OYL41_13325 [Acidobacteriota bacterium]|nr:hypothetical protein [Acidobacteriota bacterium]
MPEHWDNKHESQLSSRELRRRIAKLSRGDDWATLYVAELERRRGRILFVAAIITILDDDHDEGEETFTLTLSNVSGAWLQDGTATGTIRNRDLMLAALLSRLGRATAQQVGMVAAVTLGFRGRLAGRELSRGMEREAARDWSRSARSSFHGQEEMLSLNGDLQSTLPGAALGRRSVGMPRLLWTAQEAGREVQLGYRLALLERGEYDFGVRLSGGRREAAMLGSGVPRSGADHRLLLQATLGQGSGAPRGSGGTVR